MSRCINQLGLGLVALVLMVFMALPASAQAAGWQPKFDAGQHVYVDPALANHASYPVNLSGLSKQLEAVSDKHGVSVYVVAIERTTEGGAVPAVGRVNDLVLRWQGQADFPHDRFLVILWLRYADDPSQGSVAVNAGSELRQYNLTSSDLNSPSGPVNAAIKKAAMAEGLMCYPMGGTIDGEAGDHVLLAPPYIIDESHVAQIVERLDRAMTGGLKQPAA